MSRIIWDGVGVRRYETGVDHGVLYRQNAGGIYDKGYPWNGLTTVTESPSGADANALYADNMKYLNLLAAESFGGTVEAYTYPDEFAECDGTAEPTPGIMIGQQNRKPFGLSYRTKLGNDIDPDLGYKLHLIYTALAAPSEKAFATVNDSPDAITFSWAITTTPVAVAGLKPTALIVIDSTKVGAEALANLENILYGSDGVEPRLPTPDEVIALFSGTVTEVVPVAPTYAAATHTITIPTVAGVVYTIDGAAVTGDVVITQDTIVAAFPQAGKKFPAVVDNDWMFEF
jgi:hypothetical protein